MSNAAAPATEGPDRADGPSHVAIIMDGNGRWAAARGLPRAEGHRRGVEALRRVVRAAHELGIRYLTIFSFSSENWSRPATEIGDLFGLLRRFIRNDLATLHRDGVRVRVIGERDGLEPDICALLNEAEELTRNNRKLNLVVAFNYGSRQEIAHAAQRLAREVAEGKRDAALDRRRYARPISRCARYSRSRSDHSHQRRAAAVEFPDVAGGLQRTRVRAGPLAGFRQGRARGARSPNTPDGNAVSAVWPRKPDRDRRRSRARGDAPSRARAICLLRVAVALVLAPLAMAIAYAGGWLWAVLVTLAAIGLYVEWLTIVGAARERRVVAVGRRGAGDLGLVSPRAGSSFARRARVRLSPPWRCCRRTRRLGLRGGLCYASAAEVASILVRLDPVMGIRRADAGLAGGLGDRYRRLFRRPRHRRPETLAAGQSQEDLGRRYRRLCGEYRGRRGIRRVWPRQGTALDAKMGPICWSAPCSRLSRSSAICSNRP